MGMVWWRSELVESLPPPPQPTSGAITFMLVMLWYPGVVVPGTRPSVWFFLLHHSAWPGGITLPGSGRAGNRKHEGWCREHLPTIHWNVHVMQPPWSRGEGESKDKWYKLLVRRKKFSSVLSPVRFSPRHFSPSQFNPSSFYQVTVNLKDNQVSPPIGPYTILILGD